MKYQEIFPVPVEWFGGEAETMAESVNAWAEKEVRSLRLEKKEDYGSLLEPAMRVLYGGLGLGTMLLPGEMGGGDLTSPEAALTVAACLEQAGRADTGIAFVFANTLALQYSLTVSHVRREAALGHAGVFGSSDLAVGALVLPGYSSAAEELSFNGMPFQVRGSSADGSIVLEGAGVRPQCSGADAVLFGVVCSLDAGPALVLVPGDSGGLTRGGVLLKTGLAASRNADLSLKGVRVSDDALVFEGEEGLKSVLSWYYLGCAAACCGAMLASWEILKEWGDTRVIKGTGNVFKENPLAAALMGEVAGRLTACRLLTYSLAGMLSRPENYGQAGGGAMYAAATAVYRQVSEMAIRSIDNAMELMASAGYATEWNLERYWRDVKTIQTYVVPETVAQTDVARHCYELERL